MISLRKGFSILLIFFVSILLIEVLLRTYYHFIATPESQSFIAIFADDNFPDLKLRYQPHPYLSYTLTPNYKNITGKTNHNSLGFRGPEIGKPSKNTVCIVTIGGSTTYDVNISDDKNTYPYKLQEYLNKATNSSRFEVINAGVPGYTTWESLINIAIRVLELKPDILILYQAVNDLHAQSVCQYVCDNTGYRHSWQFSMNWKLFILKHSYIVRVLRSLFINSKSLGVEHYTNVEMSDYSNPPQYIHEPVYFKKNLEKIIKLAKAFDIEVILCTFCSNPQIPGHYASTEYYKKGFLKMNEIIRDCSRKFDLLCIDLENMIPMKDSLWYDGVHLNEAGSDMKAHIIGETILLTHTIEKVQANKK